MAGEAGTAASLTLAAPAKVNLSLEVLGRRADGYHLLESLVVFAGFGDMVTLSPDSRLTLVAEGPFASALPAPKSNLVLRAARLLAEVSGVTEGARVVLNKRLPLAAGLGGGSADAAAVLLGLNRLWRLALSRQELMDLASGLGADLPVCLFGRPALMRGIGEEVEAAPELPPAWLLLVNPGLALATAAVFGARSEPFSTSRPWPGALADLDALVALLAERPNDLQAAACRLCPPVEEVLAALAAAEGCLLGRMSGSGASCFGLFAGEAEARSAAARLSSQHPDWWVKAAPVALDAAGT